jgi:hypothetical protein
MDRQKNSESVTKKRMRAMVQPNRCWQLPWLLKKSVFLKKVENRVIENAQETGKNRL